MGVRVTDDVDLSWGQPEEYEVTYRDGTSETVELGGREAAAMARRLDVEGVSRVTGFGANPRRLP